MSPENAKRIQEAVAKAGDFLKDKLPPHPFDGAPRRNSYAHLWKCIKTKMGKSYKECEDFDVEQILEIIEWNKNNPQ